MVEFYVKQTQLLWHTMKRNGSFYLNFFLKIFLNNEVFNVQLKFETKPSENPYNKDFYVYHYPY